MHTPLQEKDLSTDVVAAPLDRGSRALAGLTILMLVIALICAAKWGLASAGHTFAMWHFTSWQKSNQTPDVRMWKWVHEAMYWSIKLDPDHAEYLNDMGRLYEFTAIKMAEHDSQVKPLLEISLTFFRDAVRRRPSWARAWANLTLTKHRLGNIDEEFMVALDRSIQLGPAVPAVQQIVAEAGIANWRALSVSMRKKVLLNIHGGLGSLRKRQIVSIMDYYNMRAYFCKILPSSDQKKVCKKQAFLLVKMICRSNDDRQSHQQDEHDRIGRDLQIGVDTRMNQDRYNAHETGESHALHQG